jgi:hypothetical protein
MLIYKDLTVLAYFGADPDHRHAGDDRGKSSTCSRT